MEKNTVEIIKEAIVYLKDNKVSYEDAEGNTYTLEKAMNSKVFVRPVDGKVKAQDLLLKIGIDINDPSVKKTLGELVSLIGGGNTKNTASKISKNRLSDDEKRNLVKEFKESGSNNKREFTNNKGIGYQSFLKWEKELSDSK